MVLVFEKRDSTSRFTAELRVQLPDTALTWSRQVAPFVEWYARTLPSQLPSKQFCSCPGYALDPEMAQWRTKRDSACTKNQRLRRTLRAELRQRDTAGGQYSHVCSLTESGERIAAAQHLSKDASRAPKAQAHRPFGDRSTRFNYRSFPLSASIIATNPVQPV
jgi:hypothetical protein